MPLREQTPTSLILSIAALALAILAGAVIAFSGGGGGDPATLRWTPPAPTLIPAPTATRTPAPTPPPAATPEPSATPTRARPTATVAPSATPAPAAAAAGATETAASVAVAPVARILQGPANLRSGPGADFGVVIVASEGATFEATGQTADGAWLRLCCVADAPVWVAGQLVELPAGAALPVVE